ncbi:MAG: hypothetical protein QNJ71_03090 [Acidimicrobiia bacterium]|nr:hypothetical protein [Acidimicrobiia bacterium]
MRRWWLIVATMVTAAACTNAAEPTPDDTTTTTLVTTTTQSVDTSDACLSGDLPFETEGLVAAIGDTDADATGITQIRWQQGAACERLVIDFATASDAPATTLGLTGVTVIPSAGVVRVDLPEDILTTAVADSLTDGLISRTFVVRADDGLGIDIHAAEGMAIAARAFTTSSPASLVVDVIPAPDEPVPVGAGLSSSTVVITPGPGPALYPFTVEAYAVPGVRTAHVQLVNGDADPINLTIALDGETDAWQAFSTQFDTGPSGEAVLFVGQVGGDDQPVNGVEIPLDLP